MKAVTLARVLPASLRATDGKGLPPRSAAPLRGLPAGGADPARSLETAARLGHDFSRLALGGAGGPGGRTAGGALQAKLQGAVIQRQPRQRQPPDEDEGIELQPLGQPSPDTPDSPETPDAPAPVQAAATPPAAAPATAAAPEKPLPYPKTPEEGLARHRQMRSKRTASLLKSLETDKKFGETDEARASKASYRTASLHAADRTREKLLANQEKLRSRRRRPAAPAQAKPPGHWVPIHG